MSDMIAEWVSTIILASLPISYQSYPYLTQLLTPANNQSAPAAALSDSYIKPAISDRVLEE